MKKFRILFYNKIPIHIMRYDDKFVHKRVKFLHKMCKFGIQAQKEETFPDSNSFLKG